MTLASQYSVLHAERVLEGKIAQCVSVLIAPGSTVA